MKRKLKNLIATGLTLTMLLSVVVISAGASNSELYLEIDPSEIEWVVKYQESFDQPVEAPKEWTPAPFDRNGNFEDDPFFGDDGYALHVRSVLQENANRMNELEDWSAYRQSYTFGQDDWLTIETFGRGTADSPPATGGKFIIDGNGKAVMVCEDHNDAAIIGSTNPLPATYRLEVTVSNIDVGGRYFDTENFTDIYEGDKLLEHWLTPASANPYVDYNGGRYNGYFQESRDMLSVAPWGDGSAIDENGMYFLAIVDYGNPRPHNNIFIHHHRKVAMDTDNNLWDNGGGKYDSWSGVYDENGNHRVEGSRYLNMIWIDSETYKSDGEKTYADYINSGGNFYSYTSQGPERGTTFLDKYLPGESYTFAIVRTPESYTLEVTGKFYYAGEHTYSHTKRHIGDETNMYMTTNHFNQTLEELRGVIPPNDTIDWVDQVSVAAELRGIDTSTIDWLDDLDSWPAEMETWPEESVYPDYFYFGIPHINYYAGTAEFSNLTLYVPKNSADDPNYTPPYTGGGGSGNSRPKPVPVPESEFCDGGEGCPAGIFGDITGDSRFHQAVEYVVESGLMKGVKDGVFNPTGIVTRGTVVTILHRLAGTQIGGTSDFADVAAGSWYADAVAWAVDNEIVVGTSDTTFSPDAPVTREQMAVLLYRYLVSMEIELPQTREAASFSDEGSISDWALEAVQSLYQAEIFDSIGSGFGPSLIASRAEIAQVFYNLAEKIA